MEPAQVEKRISWLDDQRLKDSDRVGKLGDKLTRLEQALTRQSKLTQELSGEAARLSGLATRIAQLDDTLAKHRQEVSRLLKTAEERRTEKEREIQQLAKADQKELSKALAELRKDVDRVAGIGDSLEARREEENRISRALDANEKRLDALITRDEERSRSHHALEEARNQDDRRMQEVQILASELHVKEQTLRGAFDALDDRARRIEVRLGEISASESERLELQQLWVEQQGRRMVDFERAWKEWEKRFAAFENKAEQIDQRIQAYGETDRGARQLQRDLEATVTRIETRITEVGEMQRLAEERFKQEWAEFETEDHRRWTTHNLTASEQWREHGRLHDRIVKEEAALVDGLRKVQTTLAGLQEIERRHLGELLAAIRGWVAEMQESPPKR